MGTETIRQIQEPWSAQQQHLITGFNRADTLLGKGGPRAYQGSTVAPMSGQTNQALNAINQQAYNNPMQRGAENYFQQTMSGKYLNANPYLDRMYDNAADSVTRNFNESVLPGVSARFGMAGRSGSGLMQNAVQGAYRGLGDSLSGMAANLYGSNYAQERQNQQQMAEFAPNLMNSQAGLYDNALRAGNVRDAYGQAQLSDRVNRYNFEQERPYKNLQYYQGMINGNYGQNSQTTQPTYETPWYMKAAGAAGLIGGIYNAWNQR